jgi:hypothetical protein
LTACHQCEWRPHLHEQAAADQCGFRPMALRRSGSSSAASRRTASASVTS